MNRRETTEWIGLGASAGLALVVSSAVFATGHPAFEMDDYFRIRRVAELEMSGDGQFLAYAVQSSSLAENRIVRQVYVRSLSRSDASDPAEQLDDMRNLSWRAGTHELGFLSERRGETQVFSYNVATKETRQYTNSTSPVIAFRFAGQGGALAYLTRAGAVDAESFFGRLQGDRGIIVDTAAVGELDFLAPRTAPPAAILWIISPEAGAPMRISIPGDVQDFHWSSTGQMMSIKYVADDAPPSLTRAFRTSIGIYDLNSRRFWSLAKAGWAQAPQAYQSFQGGEWIPNESKILLRKVVETDPWVSPSFPLWAIVDARTELTEEDRAWHEVQTYSGIDDNLQFVPVNDRTIFLENTLNAKSALYVLSELGISASGVAAGIPGGSSFFRFSEDFSRVAFVNQGLARAPEIYVRRGQRRARRLTELNREVTETTKPTVREVSWSSVDGQIVKGWLFEPVDPDRPKPWPLITYVHGGPSNVFADDFATNFKWWPYPFEVYATHGMAVFVPNYRGTSTFGKQFKAPKALDREPVDDVITGVKYLIQCGVADATRLGISGHSHGAWLGPLIMTRAKLFRAASFAEGAPNLLTLYTLASGRLNREVHEIQYGANPYDSPQRYLDLSPELKFEGLHTASLFEAGAQALAINMLGYPKAAQHAGIPTEYIVYPRTLHNIRTPRLQRESAEINLDWFLFWLEDKENADPTKSEQYVRWSALRSFKGAPLGGPLSSRVGATSATKPPCRAY